LAPLLFHTVFNRTVENFHRTFIINRAPLKKLADELLGARIGQVSASYVRRDNISRLR
jgi:hypothetical protein